MSAQQDTAPESGGKGSFPRAHAPGRKQRYDEGWERIFGGREVQRSPDGDVRPSDGSAARSHHGLTSKDAVESGSNPEPPTNSDGPNWGQDPEKCIVCGGPEPCSHNFDDIKFPEHTN